MNSLKRFFVLDAVAKKEKIKVSESEVQSAVMQTAQMLAAQAPELVPQFIQDRNRIAEIRWSVLENKTLDHLREKVEIIEKG